MLRHSLGLIAVLSTLNACGDARPNATGDEQALTTERGGDDVTVLQGWIGKTVGRVYPNGYPLGDIALDLSKCNGDDCTTAADEVLDSPVLGKFTYDAERSGQCETIELRTVIKRAAFDAPSFRGIGFYLSSLGGEHVLVDKGTLAARADAGEVTLKDGTKAIVHRVVAQGTCFGLGGNGGSLYRRTYAFKAFAQFEADGQTYKIWDGVPTDYNLGRRPDGDFVKSFDRQDELLLQR